MIVIPGAAYLDAYNEILVGCEDHEHPFLRDSDGVEYYSRPDLVLLYSPGDDVRVQYLPDGKVLTAITHDRDSDV